MARGRLSRDPWPSLALGLIALAAGALNFSNLGVNGWGNQYYAAAVRSMLGSWQAFRYACFDPACFVTVDKPPLAFWLETASSSVFGFGTLGVMGPSALAGALSVLALGHTVSRCFGTWSGVIAAVALALTPVMVVTSRSNNPDAILVLLVVLGASAGVRALESARWRWVVFTALLFGLGFVTKMLAAFVAVPVILIAYISCAPTSLRVRLAQVLAGAVIVAILSVGWMLSVDLTPASDRPWVGGSGVNSEFDLAFGGNGIQRLLGLDATGSSGGAYIYVSSGGSGVAITSVQSAPDANGAAITLAGGQSVNVGSVAAASFGGPVGVSRLLSGGVAEQASWLLPFGVIGAISALLAVRRCHKQRRWLAGLMVFGGWTALAWTVFSFAGGIFHPYYVSALAPGVAALVGAGSVALIEDVVANRWRLLLPAAAIASTAWFEWSLLQSSQSLVDWSLALLVTGLAVAVAIVLSSSLGEHRNDPIWRREIPRCMFGLGLAVLLVAPACWAMLVPSTRTDGMVPMARGPAQAPDTAGFTEGVDTARLLGFLQSNAGQDKYLLATDSPPIGGIVDALIAQSGENIIPLGGFGGSGSLTSQQLAAWVTQGQLRYFLLNGGFVGTSPLTRLTSDIKSVCQSVPTSAWGSNDQSEASGVLPDTLYDCAGRGSQLLAAAHAEG